MVARNRNTILQFIFVLNKIRGQKILHNSLSSLFDVTEIKITIDKVRKMKVIAYIHDKRGGWCKHFIKVYQPNPSSYTLTKKIFRY